MLVRGRVARRGRMARRVDDAQLRPVRTREQARVQLVVREEQRVRARVVRVEVDDVAAREVAREQEVEDVWKGRWTSVRRNRVRVLNVGWGSQSPWVCSHFPLMWVSQKEVTAASTFCCVSVSFQKS